MEEKKWGRTASTFTHHFLLGVAKVSIWQGKRRNLLPTDCKVQERNSLKRKKRGGLTKKQEENSDPDVVGARKGRSKEERVVTYKNGNRGECPSGAERGRCLSLKRGKKKNGRTRTKGPEKKRNYHRLKKNLAENLHTT